MARVTELKRQQLSEILRDAEERIWTLLVDSHEKGRRWEECFASLATARGLHVERGCGRGDIRVSGLVVQCKHIDAIRPDGAIDIANMRPVAANGNHRGYLVGEYDVLALRHHNSIYIIPSQVLNVGDGSLTGRVRISEITGYIDHWGVFSFDYVPPKRARQMILPIDEVTTDGTAQG